MPIFLSHQGNENKNYNEVLPNISKNEYYTATVMLVCPVVPG